MCGIPCLSQGNTEGCRTFCAAICFHSEAVLAGHVLGLSLQRKNTKTEGVELLENDGDNYQTGNHRPSVDVKVQHITLVNGVAGMELE